MLTVNLDISMSTPNSTKKSVTIVGLPNEYTKEEVMKSIITQNHLVTPTTRTNLLVGLSRVQFMTDNRL